MVRIVIRVICLSIILVSCNRNINVKKNDHFCYHNVNKSIEFPKEIDSLFISISVDSINIYDYKNVKQGDLICAKYSQKLDSIFAECFRMDSGPIRYTVGRISPMGKIMLEFDNQAYLVMLKNYFRSYIVLFCVANNRLTSVIPISTVDNNIVGYKTYFDRKSKVFLIVANPNFNLIDTNYPGVEDFWSRIGLMHEQNIQNLYSSFKFDKNGRLIFVKSKEVMLKKYLK